MSQEYSAEEFKFTTEANGVEIRSNVELSDKEALGYVNHELNKYLEKPDYILVYVVDDENVDIASRWRNPKNFERIRRITGYLVGTLDRFNDGKRAEESERVKHQI